jgi:hypothetical protein
VYNNVIPVLLRLAQISLVASPWNICQSQFSSIMKASTVSALFGAAVFAALPINAAPTQDKKRDVDTRYPYTGPEIPIGDWIDATVNGNGKGFIRLVEPPAVAPRKHAEILLHNRDSLHPYSRPQECYQ